MATCREDTEKAVSSAHHHMSKAERNSLSGKSVHLPRHLVRDGRVPAHIGEALLPTAVGNPEGSLRDPLTTDPKGEVRRAAV
jgi:hypothetical protein